MTITMEVDQKNNEMLPENELNQREIELLKAHLDRQRLERWNKIAGREKPTFRRIDGGRRWFWLAMAASVGLLFCWLGGSFFGPKPSQIAATKDVLDYPFEPTALRGEAVEQLIERTSAAVNAYRKGDFAAALAAAAARDAFFRGMCLWKMKKPAEALAEFEKIEKPSAEARFFTASALADLGRKAEARAAFEAASKDPTARDPYRKAAAERATELKEAF